MNTYSKYCPNVFLAKCTEKHEKGSVIQVTTKYGKENACIVFNLVYEKGGFFYYSIVREDGFDARQWAAQKAEKYNNWATNADKKSHDYYNKSHNLVKYIPMGQPILVGHHSEKSHRATLEKSWNAMGKSVEMSNKSEAHSEKAAYWESRADDINLSMPESIEYYEFELEKAKLKHQGLKNGTIERAHSFSLTYAKKEVNELEKKLKLAKTLWG